MELLFIILASILLHSTAARVAAPPAAAGEPSAQMETVEEELDETPDILAIHQKIQQILRSQEVEQNVLIEILMAVIDMKMAQQQGSADRNGSHGNDRSIDRSIANGQYEIVSANKRRSRSLTGGNGGFFGARGKKFASGARRPGIFGNGILGARWLADSESPYDARAFSNWAYFKRDGGADKGAKFGGMNPHGLLRG